MLRTILALLLFSISIKIMAQGQPSADPAGGKMAKVNVSVTTMDGKPSKGEQVLFRNNITNEIKSGYSDAAGKLNIELAGGASYSITVKSITDTTKYGTISIPALKTDEFFTEPYKVNIKYEAARTYTLENVHFDSGKASLRPESFPSLEELFKYLKNKDDIKVEIAGHTDSRGNDTLNLKLSQQRAETIKSYLVKKGIQPGRIVAKGYGATEPVADNETEEGRQMNRRTEVRII
ncbi:MAG: OmpA family protein [Chitinophagaceae bacterium]|nr:OmpA family protein [Chitinophagaceae bacterium]